MYGKKKISDLKFKMYLPVGFLFLFVALTFIVC